MNNWINAKDLFGNNYKAAALGEYEDILSLIKQLIEISDEAVQCRECLNFSSHNGVCYLFAKSIIDYTKMAYDNLVLGHFFATNMVIRNIVENNVCLDIILNDEKQELWKYYLVQSYRKTIIKAKGKLALECEEIFKKICLDFNISNDFIEKENKKKAYIDLPYGWTYKINNQFSFKGLCDLVDMREYDDFKMMSEYSHGTSIYQKMGGSTGIEHIMNMLSCMYAGLCKLVAMYCREFTEDDFDIVAEEIEEIFLDSVAKME